MLRIKGAAADRRRHQHSRLRPSPGFAVSWRCPPAHNGRRRGHGKLGNTLALRARISGDRHASTNLQPTDTDEPSARSGGRVAGVAQLGSVIGVPHSLGHFAPFAGRRPCDRTAGARRPHCSPVSATRRPRIVVGGSRLQPVWRARGGEPADQLDVARPAQLSTFRSAGRDAGTGCGRVPARPAARRGYRICRARRSG